MNRIEFGELIRKRRSREGYTLRGFAKMVGISPTYLSKIERGDYPPPGEKKIVRIAETLVIDSDLLLAMAGKVATDLQDIIRNNPVAIAKLLREKHKLELEVEREKWGR